VHHGNGTQSIFYSDPKVLTISLHQVGPAQARPCRRRPRPPAPPPPARRPRANGDRFAPCSRSPRLSRNPGPTPTPKQPTSRPAAPGCPRPHLSKPAPPLETSIPPWQNKHASQNKHPPQKNCTRQDSNYPIGSGPITDTGSGPGAGFCINVPLPPGSGGGAYRAAFDRVVLPALEAYRPQLIFVSAGFDASAMDPLASQMLVGQRGPQRAWEARGQTACKGLGRRLAEGLAKGLQRAGG
jgi:hypothetical protein